MRAHVEFSPVDLQNGRCDDDLCSFFQKMLETLFVIKLAKRATLMKTYETVNALVEKRVKRIVTIFSTSFKNNFE